MAFVLDLLLFLCFFVYASTMILVCVSQIIILPLSCVPKQPLVFAGFCFGCCCFVCLFFLFILLFLCIYVNSCLWGPEDGVRVPATFSCRTWVLGTQVMCKNNPSSYLLNNFFSPLVCVFGGFFFLLFELWDGLTVLNLASSCIINFLAKQRSGHF